MTQRIACLIYAAWKHQSSACNSEKPVRKHVSSLCPQNDDVLKWRDPLAEICLRYTPHVGLVEVPQPDCLFLDLTDIPHLVGDERQFAIQLLMGCHQEGYFPMQMAITDTPGAAWAMAHFASRKGHDVISSVWILPPGHGMKWMTSLPVEALRIPDSVASWCHELGLHHIGDLVPFPIEELRNRFGEILVLRLEQLMGTRKELLLPYIPPPQFEEHLWLEYPVQSWEALRPGLSSVLDRLSQHLVSHNSGALGLHVNLVCEDHSVVTLPVSLFRPTFAPQHLLELIELGFRQKHFSSPIVGIDVLVSHVAPLESRQVTFFSDEEDEVSSSEWGDLLERLSARLGSACVCEAVLNPDHDPEKAYFWQPCLSNRRLKKPRANLLSFLQERARPTRLFRAPVPLQVTTAIPSGVPYRIHHRGQRHDVVRWWGPERIQTGWWRGQPIARDYYRVELENGVHYWIYRRLEDGDWFLHGTFG